MKIFALTLLLIPLSCSAFLEDEPAHPLDRGPCLALAEKEWKVQARLKCPYPEDCESGKAVQCWEWDACPSSKELEATLTELQARCSTRGAS
jgi:hypothetical protein